MSNYDEAKCEVSRLPQIIYQLKRLDDAVSQCADAVSQLGDKLLPVARVEPPAAPRAKEPISASLVPIAASIDSKVLNILAIAAQINSLMERIEL